MAELVVPLRKEINDSLTRPRHAKCQGPPQKRTGRKGKKGMNTSSERAHKQVLTMKKNLHFILHRDSSTRALFTVSISTAPDGGYHCKSMRTQSRPAHIPHNMLRDFKAHPFRPQARRCKQTRLAAGMAIAVYAKQVSIFVCVTTLHH